MGPLEVEGQGESISAIAGVSCLVGIGPGVMEGFACGGNNGILLSAMYEQAHKLLLKSDVS